VLRCGPVERHSSAVEKLRRNKYARHGVTISPQSAPVAQGEVNRSSGKPVDVAPCGDFGTARHPAHPARFALKRHAGEALPIHLHRRAHPG
jgi:hypothetical protein